MQISELIFYNFRCFGDTAVTVSIDDLTALVGSNGCGKTAILQGLARLFGALSSDRYVEPADFHLAPGIQREDLDADKVLTLSIDAKLTFPELGDDGMDKSAVPGCFKQMVVTGTDKELFCRVRLEASWRKGNLPDGEVEQKLFWVRSEDSKPLEKHKTPMGGHDRSQIHVHYVPATRDPTKQIRYVSGTVLNRLLRAVKWSPDIETKIGESYASIQAAFAGEPGVSAVESAIGASWKILHDATESSEISLKPLGRRLEELLRNLQALFKPSGAGQEYQLDRLSDGLKSLFYLALVGATFDIEGRLIGKEEGLVEHFDVEKLDPPFLTVFALEEPENHVAPHYLGRIVSLLRQLIGSGRAQALVTSHSPAILQRILPSEVRHLRRDVATSLATVNRITLPDDESEAFKFVREAVRAFPELYFAKLVVLGEGDSEEIVLPKIARALRVDVDTSFVSIVPLGGRHVNHFWRLLNDLEIPHLTLLDLDRERHGGGWGRIRYAFEQLLQVGVDEKSLLTFTPANGDAIKLSRSDVKKLEKKSSSETLEMRVYMKHLEEFGVYFSTPLDFDFLMLENFPEAYKQLPEDATGPTIPTDITSAASKEAYKDVIAAVLKPSGGNGSTYTAARQAEFFWYRYLFLGRGKPVTHLRALTNLTYTEMRTDAPSVLERLCKKMKETLTATASDETK